MIRIVTKLKAEGKYSNRCPNSTIDKYLPGYGPELATYRYRVRNLPGANVAASLTDKGRSHYTCVS